MFDRPAAYADFFEGSGAQSTNFLAINFNASSRRSTGSDILRTAIHSYMFNGQTLKTVERISTYNTIKCRVIERAMAEMSQMLVHGGMAKSDWFSDKLLRAFNISIVTKTESAIVIG